MTASFSLGLKEEKDYIKPEKDIPQGPRKIYAVKALPFPKKRGIILIQ